MRAIVEEQTKAAELDSPDPGQKKGKNSITHIIVIVCGFSAIANKIPVGTVPSTMTSRPTGAPGSTPFDLAYSWNPLYLWIFRN